MRQKVIWYELDTKITVFIAFSLATCATYILKLKGFSNRILKMSQKTKIWVPIGNKRLKPLKFMWKHPWTLELFILSEQGMVSSNKCIQIDSKSSAWFDYARKSVVKVKTAQYWIVTHIHVCVCRPRWVNKGSYVEEQISSCAYRWTKMT